MMKPCEKCLENNWKYAASDGIVTATCKYCDAEVSFPTRKSKKYYWKDCHTEEPSDQSHRYIPSPVDPLRDTALMPWE